MSKFTKFSLFLFIICLMGLSSVAGYYYSEISRFNDSESIKKLDDIELISNIALKNAELNDYEINVYDCSEFSDSLNNTLNLIGYESKILCGYLNDENYEVIEQCNGYEMTKGGGINKSAHAWVYIPELNIHIEATSGKFITKSVVWNE